MENKVLQENIDRIAKYNQELANKILSINLEKSNISLFQNENGEYIAFGGRTLEKDAKIAKYINSSDSLIYNKSRVLYGLNSAKDAIKNEDAVVVMEGYFDVISAHANGIENAVGSCGTAMTAEHVKLLSRYTKSRRIYLSFASNKFTNRSTFVACWYFW